MANEQYAYPLFNDIEDSILRAANRANILANISEDFMDSVTKIVSSKGIAVSIQYLTLVPEDERGSVVSKFREVMTSRGYLLRGAN
jgi:hypothetical protein